VHPIKNIIIILLCLSENFLFAQKVWDTMFGAGSNNTVSANIIQNDDSSFVVLNYILDSASGRQDIGLMKLSNKGILLNERSFNMFSNSFYFELGRNHFIKASNSSYLLSGAAISANNDVLYSGKIGRYSLDTVFCRVHPPSWYVGMAMNAFYKLSPNKFIFTGSNCQNNFCGATIWHVDSNQSITYKKNIINPNGFAPHYSDINSYNNNILITGAEPPPSPWYGMTPNTLFQFDQFGNAINAMSIATGSTSLYLGQVVFDPLDTSFILLGAIETQTWMAHNYLVRLAVIKVDAITLKERWHYAYGEECSINSVNDAVIESDGSIICSAFYSPLCMPYPYHDHDQRGVIFKLNKNGNFLWARVITTM
jgi:hypothetical protein